MPHTPKDPSPPQNLSSTPPTPPAVDRRQFLKLTGLGAATLLLGGANGLQAHAAKALNPKKPTLTPQQALLALPASTGLTAHNYDHLLGGHTGLSDSQVKQHVGLYQGYVKKANEIHTALHAAQPDVAKVNATYDPFRELLVESSFAINGVILHELYFDNLGSAHPTPSAFVQAVLAKYFGSWDGFVNQLKASAKAMRGWAMVGFNLRDNGLHLYGMDTHNQWVPMHVMPILVLDVYEHAYMIDFGTNRMNYIDTMLAHINWAVVEARLSAIPTHTRTA
jgi:superoxide dismutase, Fe-Mn family